MLTNVINLLAAFSKVFSMVNFLNLPLINTRKYIFKSETMLIVFLFLFVVGETKTIFPALIITAFYVYLEIMPNKLKIVDNFNEDYYTV